LLAVCYNNRSYKTKEKRKRGFREISISSLGRKKSNFPIIQYADDTLIIMEGDVIRQLVFLKCILQSFSDSIGLKVNYNKSFLVPINIDKNRASHLATTLGCVVGTLPLTYLGLPLGTPRPKIHFLIMKCERRLIATSTFLSQAGRLKITNAVLTVLPTFHMCALALPKGVIKKIDKYRKHSLWRGADLN
jgi:hypothetical protein